MLRLQFTINQATKHLQFPALNAPTTLFQLQNPGVLPPMPFLLSCVHVGLVWVWQEPTSSCYNKHTTITLDIQKYMQKSRLTVSSASVSSYEWGTVWSSTNAVYTFASQSQASRSGTHWSVSVPFPDSLTIWPSPTCCEEIQICNDTDSQTQKILVANTEIYLSTVFM